MNIEHFDCLVVLQRSKAEVNSVQLDHESQHATEPIGELASVLGSGNPGEALVFVVVVGRQLLDALREEVAQCHRVGRKKRAQRKIFGHLILGPDGALCLETSART